MLSGLDNLGIDLQKLIHWEANPCLAIAGNRGQLAQELSGLREGGMDRLPTGVAGVENLPEEGPEREANAPDPFAAVLLLVTLREEVSGKERLEESLEAGPV